MSEGNVIMVSFGKPCTPKMLENQAEIIDHCESATLDFSNFFDSNKHGLLNRSKLIVMFAKEHLFTLGLEFPEESDYQWLKDHKEHIEKYLAKVRRIETRDDGKKWTVDRSRKPIVQFPPDFPGKIRLFLFVEEDENKSYEVLREGVKGVALVT